MPLLDKRCNQKQYRRRPPPIKNHRIKWHVGVVHQHKVWIRHNDLIQINHCSYGYILSSFDMCRIYLFFMSIGQTKTNSVSFSRKKENHLLFWKRDWRSESILYCWYRWMFYLFIMYLASWSCQPIYNLLAILSTPLL